MPIISTLGASSARSFIDSKNIAAQRIVALLDPDKLPDPHFQNVELLIHSDNTDGSILFKDNSFLPKKIVAKGNIHHSTLTSKFGKSSILLENIGDYLQIYVVSIPEFTDFTIEGTFSISSFPKAGERTILISQNSSCGLFIYNTGKNSVLCWYNGSTIECMTSEISLNTLYHFAATRAGSNIRVFLDGKAGPIYSSWHMSDINITNIGGNSENSIVGNIEEIRITNRIARYTSNFISPIEVFSDG